MSKVKIYSAVVLLALIIGVCTACQSTVVEEVSQAQKESDSFIKVLEDRGEFEKLLFLNEAQAIYYKELQDAPVSNKGIYPLQNSTVSVTIRGELADTGQEFQPETKIPNLTIYGYASQSDVSPLVDGVQIALQNMEVGDSWEVVIPWQLGYGSRSGSSLIPAYAPLRFFITLEEIVKL